MHVDLPTIGGCDFQLNPSAVPLYRTLNARNGHAARTVPTEYMNAARAQYRETQEAKARQPEQPGQSLRGA
jgi:hypothetical protein